MDNSDNALDIASSVGYNENNDNMIVVKMDEQAPAHDTSCTHENLVADPEDTIGNAVFHGCTNPKCGVGFYIQPTK